MSGEVLPLHTREGLPIVLRGHKKLPAGHVRVGGLSHHSALLVTNTVYWDHT
jgi:hypothetical protein